MKSLSCVRSVAYSSKMTNWGLESGVCIYTYLGGTPSVPELWVLSRSSGGVGGIPGRGGAHCGGGAPMPLCHQSFCGFISVPFWQGRQLSVWFSSIIAGCLCIAACTLVYPGNTSTRLFSSLISAQDFFISWYVSCITACEIPPVSILDTFKARLMLDCSSGTRPPSIAIVADMLKTSKKLVAASQVRFGYYLNHIQLRSLLWGVWHRFLPFTGMLTTKFVCEYPRMRNIMMFDFADCDNKCLGQPWSYPVTGNKNLVT